MKNYEYISKQFFVILTSISHRCYGVCTEKSVSEKNDKKIVRNECEKYLNNQSSFLR